MTTYQDRAALWEKHHRTDNGVDALFPHTPGSPPAQVLSAFGIDPPPPLARVLDIGIGTGDMARYLDSLDCLVFATDISDAALAKAQDSAVTFPPGRISKLRDIDLAICYHVAGHMPPEECAALIALVMPTLAPWGRFCLEIPVWSGEPLTEFFIGQIEAGYLWLYEPGWSEKVIREMGLKLVRFGKMQPCDQVIWQRLTIGNPDAR